MAKDFQLKPGDLLLTQNPQGLGKLIRWGQERLHPGDPAVYSHAAGVLDSCGNIFESSWRLQVAHISAYHGCLVLVARHKEMDRRRFLRGLEEVWDNLGMVYPFHRLFFSLFRIADNIYTNWPVCSEYYAQFLVKAGLYGGWGHTHWAGVTPDMLEDAVYLGEVWEVVYEGALI